MNVTAPPLEAYKPHRLTWGLLLSESYRLYRERFWKLFGIALLPYCLAYVTSFFPNFAFDQLSNLGVKISLPLVTSYTVIYVLGWIQAALYWGISGFFFAAVASNILSGGEEAAPAVSDAFTRARDRIGVVTGVALVCWTLYWVGQLLAFLALKQLRNALVPHRSSQSMILFQSLDILTSLMVAGLVSRFGLAIPTLIEKPDSSLREALKFSAGKTESWEPFFMIFLVKSWILGYAAFSLSSYALRWLWRNGTLNLSTYPWAARAANVAIIAALAPPLFIAFSLLYQESIRPREDMLFAAAAAPIE